MDRCLVLEWAGNGAGQKCEAPAGHLPGLRHLKGLNHIVVPPSHAAADQAFVPTTTVCGVGVGWAVTREKPVLASIC